MKTVMKEEKNEKKELLTSAGIPAVLSVLIIVCGMAGVAGAYAVSAHANESQLELINEIYGQKMTQGEFWQLVFPEEYTMMKDNMTPEEFKNFSETEKYWGDDHPELPYGANVWDENGPVNLNEISDEEKEGLGLGGVIVDDSGYIILGFDNDTKGAMERLEAYGDVSGENFLNALASGLYSSSPVRTQIDLIRSISEFLGIF
ncbi:hypothetical protein J2128_002167 [Methanomicrobium sp. W14]|uniref:hypothetical protein n=1 Tax=Methanomicrobium sp. W14 TaxID=2817839 RepID=UPI001AE31034|nr:hypothetical protein [Methanomicrobium sp. W14]MBP2134201.1 hypothetical protein [Methanomicrobium sp. W14]